MVTAMLLNSVCLGIINGKIGEVMAFVFYSFISVLTWFFCLTENLLPENISSYDDISSYDVTHVKV